MANIFSTNGSGKKNQSGNTSNNSLEKLHPSSGAIFSREKGSILDREKPSGERVLFHTQKIKEQEKIVYDRKKRETEEEIKALQQAIIELIKTAETLERNVEIAAQKAVINPGRYDVSFLRKLKSLIANFLEKAEDASVWLAAFNQKGKKKGLFWNKFTGKGGGGHVLLSPDSYLSRSAG